MKAAARVSSDASLTLGSTVGVVFASAMALFMVNLDATVVNIVLPELSGQLLIPASQSALVVLSYLLSLTGSTLVFGRLSDMKGPERIFIGGYLVFAFGSGLCALAWSLWSLAAFRLLQGLGAAMLLATSAVMVMRYIPARLRGRAYAVNGALAGLGFALGSPIGGLLSDLFNWRAVFLVNLPIGVLGLILCLFFLNRRDAAAPQQPFDAWGGIASFLALGAAVFALQGLADGSDFDWRDGTALAFAVGTGALFLVIESRREAPLLRLSIFRNWPLDFALVSYGFYYAILQGTAFVFPFFLIGIVGLTSVQAGNLLFAGPIVSMILGPLAGWISDRVGPKWPSLVGALLFVVTAALFLNFNADTPGVLLLGALMVMGVGLSLFSAPMLALIMSHAKQDTIGILSSIKAVVPFMLGLVGVGCFAALYSDPLTNAGQAAGANLLGGFHRTMVLMLALAIACVVTTLFARGAKPVSQSTQELTR